MTGLNIHHVKMYFLFKMGIFQCHVSFQGCNPNNGWFFGANFCSYIKPLIPKMGSSHQDGPLPYMPETFCLATEWFTMGRGCKLCSESMALVCHEKLKQNVFSNSTDGISQIELLMSFQRFSRAPGEAIRWKRKITHMISWVQCPEIKWNFQIHLIFRLVLVVRSTNGFSWYLERIPRKKKPWKKNWNTGWFWIGIPSK